MKYATFKIWDSVGKIYFDKEHESVIGAKREKDGFLDDGNYPDRPHTVLSIHRFENGKFIKAI